MENENLCSFLYTSDNIVQIDEFSFTVAEAVIAEAGFMDFFSPVFGKYSLQHCVFP